MHEDRAGGKAESGEHRDGWARNMSNAEIEEGIAIFERACAEGPITSDGGRQFFSTSFLRNQLQTLKEIRELRRHQAAVPICDDLRGSAGKCPRPPSTFNGPRLTLPPWSPHSGNLW